MWDITEKTSPNLFGVTTEIRILTANTFGSLFITQCVEAKGISLLLFFFFVVVVVGAGLLSALCLPGSTFTKLPTPCLQGRAICYFYLVSAVCYNSRPPQGELLFKQHSHIIIFFFFYFFGTVHIPYEYPTIHMSSSGLGWNISAVYRVRDGECTGRTCLLNV